MKRILFRARIDDIDLMRNYSAAAAASSIKQNAIQNIGLEMWFESTQYEYFKDHIEDLDFEVYRDIASMTHIVTVTGVVPDDIYSYYLLREK